MKPTIPNCRKFTGYRPCEPYKDCLNCPDEFPFGTKILMINLDHLGDVVMTTAQLPALKRKYPESYIVWITLENAVPLLQHNPYIDRIYSWNDENRMILRQMYFDVALNADKNQNSAAFMMEVNAGQKLGFGLNENGAIVPMNEGANYNYRMGLDDRLKFEENQRTGQDLLAETFELDFQRDPYVLELTVDEMLFCERKKHEYGLKPDDLVVGFNTGCSAQLPYKKMTIVQHVTLIEQLLRFSDRIKILLLGGAAETERNREINQRSGNQVIETPTTEGVRRGLLYLNLCDVVVSGDTSGMHMAIALQKNVVAWFGNSAAAEIDLYDRGQKIYSLPTAGKKWNMGTPDPACVDNLNLQEIIDAIVSYL